MSLSRFSIIHRIARKLSRNNFEVNSVQHPQIIQPPKTSKFSTLSQNPSHNLCTLQKSSTEIQKHNLNRRNPTKVHSAKLHTAPLETVHSEIPTNALSNVVHPELDFDDALDNPGEKLPGALDTCLEDVSDIAPYFPPTFNLAAYADKSPTLQELVKLGVDLYQLERRRNIAELILKLDFERDMKPCIRFLHDCGVPADSLGAFITRNPMIFKQDMDDLHTRVRYLRSHRFTVEMIARIVTMNPHWLLFSTVRLDRRLGYFQAEFKLNGKEVRAMTTRQPRLITYNMAHIAENTFAIREEMGFSQQEVKAVLLQKPRLWMKNRKVLVERFDYAHNVMKLSHEMLAKQPEVLNCRLNRMQQRHQFLVTQNRAQYDPQKPLYVAPTTLISGTDAEFCSNVAKTPVETFNLFLKTL